MFGLSKEQLIRCNSFMGKTINRLTALRIISSYKTSNGGRLPLIVCECSCGREFIIRLVSFTSGRSKSCGCLMVEKLIQRSTIHGMDRTQIYHAFSNAKRRCNNELLWAYKYYGGRGIKFLFNSLQELYDEIGNPPTEKHSIDRIDNNGNYEKGNVRWATKSEQMLNRRKFKTKKIIK